MPRLIDATRIEQYILNNCSDNEEINAIYAEIINAPTIDAEPKHAYVIVDEDGNMECSNCGSSFCFDSYCGHCGAKLMGERKKEVEVVDSMPTMWVMDEESHRCLTFPEEKGTSVRHGHWIYESDGIIAGTCSVCGWNACYCETDVSGMPYCPNCGAKMDESNQLK